MDAVLWDMDGLLVDSEPLWTVAEVELAQLLGGAWDDNIKALVVGTRLDVAVPTILRYYGANTSPDSVAKTSRWLLHRMTQLYGATAAPMPGARELHSALADEDVPQALVSSSYRVLVDAVLAQGICRFDVTVAGDEVVHGKPHPEPYLAAAERLGVDPARCVVLEDSPSGVVAGEAAGCAVVAVPSVAGVGFEPTARRLVLSSLDQARVADLRALV